ncbi:uncharacterized protein LOC132701620 [Cylas formicarius]|uniref:uncharacterized protein LOC132701620 n=1 Tax=Cylas formicarius TaxID=197179 RepID=UPI002958C985|nr:uncharacterized protein LOC132701620 [Cylas formicarius]
MKPRGGKQKSNWQGNKKITSDAAEDKNPPKDSGFDSDQEEGFSKWLKSEEGVENLKLFVIGNSLIVFLLMSWPQIKQGLDAAYYLWFLCLTVMVLYSLGVFKLVDDFFRDRFRNYLENEYKNNKFKQPEELGKFLEEARKSAAVNSKREPASLNMCTADGYYRSLVSFRCYSFGCS